MIVFSKKVKSFVWVFFLSFSFSACLKKKNRENSSENKVEPKVEKPQPEPNEIVPKPKSISYLKPLELTSLDKTLDANLAAFDSIPKKSNNGWSLDSINLFLGLSAGGEIGTLFGRGAVATLIVYERPSPTNQNLVIESRQNSTQISITPDTTLEQINDQIAPIMGGLEASGKITDLDELQNTLQNETLKIQTLFNDIQPLTNRVWQLAKIRLFLSLSANGKLSDDVSIGTGINTIIFWSPTSENPTFETKTNENKVNRLIKTLSSSLNKASIISDEKDGFRFTKAGFGIGGFASKSIGLATVTGVSAGMFLFERTEKSVDAEDTLDDLVIIDSKVKKDDLPIFAKQKIKFKILEGTAEEPKSIETSVKQEFFVDQLQKAVLRSAEITQRVSNKNSPKWKSTLVQTNFALSASGQIDSVTLGGSTSIEIQFSR